MKFSEFFDKMKSDKELLKKAKSSEKCKKQSFKNRTDFQSKILIFLIKYTEYRQQKKNMEGLYKLKLFLIATRTKPNKTKESEIMSIIQAINEGEQKFSHKRN